MDVFNETLVATIIATVAAAGIISLITYLWKKRASLRPHKKETRKETVEIERFIKMVSVWRSQDPAGMTISITQSNSSVFTTKFEKVREIEFIRKATPEKNLLILRFLESSIVKERTIFVEAEEFRRICKILYFIEVTKWKRK